MMMRMHIHRNFTAGNFVNLSLRCYVAKFSGVTNETKIHTTTLRSVICKDPAAFETIVPRLFHSASSQTFRFLLHTSDMRLQLVCLVNK